MAKHWRCLSIRQPWADVIAHGVKPIENRTWETRFRGRFLLHAGKTYDEEGALWIHDEADRLVGAAWGSRLQALVLAARHRTGGFIGAASLADCVTNHDSPWFFGPFGFVLKQARAFDLVIPYRGQQGFFMVPESVLLDAERREKGKSHV